MKYVVISSNLNDDYLFYVPIVTWAWNKLGWSVIFLSPNYEKQPKYIVVHNLFITLNENNIHYSWERNEFDYDEVSICQIARLYTVDIGKFWILDYILTSDADMMPLSDYWTVVYSEIRCYGKDLSDVHYPICYIGMSVCEWKRVMDLTSNFSRDIKRDLQDREDINSTDKEKSWVCDQNLVTERLQNETVNSIERGIYTHNGYPIGRIDRSSWARSLAQKERIDCHLPRRGYLQENWNLVMTLIKECFKVSGEEIKWMEDYRKKYLELI
jgi:hypothetical protein